MHRDILYIASKLVLEREREREGEGERYTLTAARSQLSKLKNHTLHLTYTVIDGVTKSLIQCTKRLHVQHIRNINDSVLAR